MDYQNNESTELSKSEIYVVTRLGQMQIRKSTVEWKFLVRWINGSETWVSLKYLM